jgi:hypothetical protein
MSSASSSAIRSFTFDKMFSLTEESAESILSLDGLSGTPGLVTTRVLVRFGNTRDRTLTLFADSHRCHHYPIRRLGCAGSRAISPNIQRPSLWREYVECRGLEENQDCTLRRRSAFGRHSLPAHRARTFVRRSRGGIAEAQC